MAKFTVYFKDKAIQSKIFDSGVIHIGRDETNEIVIDNLAVASAHAAVIIKDDSCIIKQLNDDFPLFINNEKSKDALLKDNDQVIIGKHTIIFSATESFLSAANDNAANKDLTALNEKLEDNSSSPLPDANLQVLDGQHIGRILPLKKSMTRFGQNGGGTVIISRRKDGYFISSLEGNANIVINNSPLSDKSFIHLNHNDIITIDNISMQFFLDS